MSPPRSLVRSIADGVVVWAALALSVLSVELALGTWSLADVAPLTDSDDLVSFVVTTAVTFGLVVGCVASYRRWRLVAPLAVLALYLGYFAVLGVSVGAAGWPFVAALYSPLVVPVLALSGGLEYLFRRRRGRPSPA
ncbi:hypothetical protein [Halomarina litorea]|uniref:hypothetical protein n=1 Tax=Halomarina litorea TaxID=2961595 RepID=UPI0020C56043|nr:hypothetical protein [Halomarina sp. BCD28]